MAGLDGAGRAFLALQCERIDISAADIFKRGDGVGAYALVRLRVQCPQMLITPVHEGRTARQIRGEGHHFGAAGHHQILHTGHDGRAGHVHAGDAGAAEAVQGHPAGNDVVARVQRRHAAQVCALFVDLGGGAPDDIVHFLGLQVVARGDCL